jgi:hypothetical protein
VPGPKSKKGKKLKGGLAPAQPRSRAASSASSNFDMRGVEDEDEDEQLVKTGGPALDDDENEQVEKPSKQKKGKPKTDVRTSARHRLCTDLHLEQLTLSVAKSLTAKEIRGGAAKWGAIHLPRGSQHDFSRVLVPLGLDIVGTRNPFYGNLPVFEVQGLVDEVYPGEDGEEYRVAEKSAFYGLVLTLRSQLLSGS